MAADPIARVAETVRAAQEILTVRRVFGEAYEVGDTTMIPVAVVRGGGGGGGGEGTGTETGHEGTGSGGGLGFGMNVRPVGVVVVRDGKVRWQPTVDVMRIVLGGQVLAGLALLVVRELLRRR